MFTEKNIQNDIAEIVNGSMMRRQPLDVEDITFRVIGKYLDDFVRGKGFVAHCIWATTRKIAGDYLARRRRSEDGGITRQQCFPGCEYMQQNYVISRNDKDTLVPTEQLSREEFIVVMDRLRGEIKTKSAHLKELEGYFKRNF